MPSFDPYSRCSSSNLPANYPYHKPNPYQIGTYKYTPESEQDISEPHLGAAFEEKRDNPYVGCQRDEPGANATASSSPYQGRAETSLVAYQNRSPGNPASHSSSPYGDSNSPYQTPRSNPYGASPYRATVETPQQRPEIPDKSPHHGAGAVNGYESPHSNGSPFRKSTYSQKSAYETHTSPYQEDPYDANSIVQSIDISNERYEDHNSLYYQNDDSRGSSTAQEQSEEERISNPSTLSYRGSAAQYPKYADYEKEGIPEEQVPQPPTEEDEEDSIPSLTKMQKLSLILILSVTLFMVALEQTIITASIPQISAALKSSEGYTWIGTAYLLASCSVLPVSGKLSDIYGRKPTILAGVAFFLLGSAVCGAAISMNMLIGGRTIQGLGCGTIMSLIHIIISDVVPLKERGLFISAVGSVWMIASCSGPLIGGAFATAGQWRWCFYINLPVAGLMGIGLIFVLKIKSPDTKAMEGLKRIDFIGVILSILATCLFLLALDWGGTKYPWNSPQVILFFVFSVVSYAAFFVYEGLWVAEPLMPPRLFKTRTRSMSFAAAFCHAVTFMGVVYFLPFLFQAVYGASAIVSSLYILPEALIMGATTALGGIVISKVGRYVEMMRAGLAFTTLFIGLLSTLSTSSPLSQRILFPALYGFSTGFNFQSFLISLQTKVRPSDIGTSVCMMLYVKQLGLSISIALVGVAFQNKISELSRRSDSVLLKKLLDGAAPASVDSIKYLPTPLIKIAREYYMEAFRYSFYVLIGFGVLGFIFCCFMPQNELEMKKENKERPVSQATNRSQQSIHDV